MDPWPFVTAGYALSIGAIVLVSIGAWRAAREAERRAGERTEER